MTHLYIFFLQFASIFFAFMNYFCFYELNTSKLPLQ